MHIPFGRSHMLLYSLEDTESERTEQTAVGWHRSKLSSLFEMTIPCDRACRRYLRLFTTSIRSTYGGRSSNHIAAYNLHHTEIFTYVSLAINISLSHEKTNLLKTPKPRSQWQGHQFQLRQKSPISNPAKPDLSSPPSLPLSCPSLFPPRISRNFLSPSV